MPGNKPKITVAVATAAAQAALQASWYTIDLKGEHPGTAPEALVVLSSRRSTALRAAVAAGEEPVPHWLISHLHGTESASSQLIAATDGIDGYREAGRDLHQPVTGGFQPIRSPDGRRIAARRGRAERVGTVKQGQPSGSTESA